MRTQTSGSASASGSYHQVAGTREPLASRGALSYRPRPSTGSPASVCTSMRTLPPGATSAVTRGVAPWHGSGLVRSIAGREASAAAWPAKPSKRMVARLNEVCRGPK